MRIMYHATTGSKAEIIAKEGFDKGSFFATHMENSFVYGKGSYLFAVYFEKDPFEKNKECWEYITSESIPPQNILYLIKISFSSLFTNHVLGKKIRLKNLHEAYGEDINICDQCKGKGEINDYFGFLPWPENKSRIRNVCPDCKGFGSVEALKSTFAAI